MNTTVRRKEVIVPDDNDQDTFDELEERNQLSLLTRRPDGSIDWSSEARVTDAQIEAFVMNAWRDEGNPFIIFRRSPVASAYYLILGLMPSFMSLLALLMLFGLRVWFMNAAVRREVAPPEPGKIGIPQVQIVSEDVSLFTNLGFFLAFLCFMFAAIGILWGINEFWNHFYRFDGSSFFRIQRRRLQPIIPLFQLRLTQGEYTFYNAHIGIISRVWRVMFGYPRSGVNPNTRTPKKGDLAFPTQEGSSDTDIDRVKNVVIDDQNWFETQFHFGTVFIASEQQGGSDNMYDVLAPNLCKRILQAANRLVKSGRISYDYSEQENP